MDGDDIYDCINYITIKLKGGIDLARKVKCYETGEWGNSDTFYKAPDNHYYKSKQIYEQRQKRNQDYNQIKDIVCFEFLGYQKGQRFPTILTRKLNELSFYPNEVILETIQDQQENIIYWLNHKDFNSDYNKIAYIFAIISNHINDVYQQWKQKQYAKQKSKEIEKIQVEDIRPSVHKCSDISNWLDEDE